MVYDFSRSSFPWGILLICLATLAGCGEETSNTEAGSAPKPTVTVVEVAQTEITPSDSFTGRVEAVDTVELRARVQGFLEKRLFEEGAGVKAGDLLFVIEKGPYQAKVGKIKGGIERLNGTLKLAEIERDRQDVLVARKAVAQVVLDEATAKLTEVKGDLTSQRAALDRAQLDLSYTDIKAPISGKIGLSRFSKGDFVGPASGALAKIVTQDPIYVTFPVSQRELLTFRKLAGEKGPGREQLAVKVRLANGELYDKVGKVNFVDVQADPGTDTITVRAEIPNPNRVLIDRQLVTAIVETDQPQTELTIPQQALQLDQAGAYVLVVDKDNKVQVRRIETGRSLTGLLVVQKGLEQAEKVIIDGIQKVRPGIVVDPTVAPPARS